MKNNLIKSNAENILKRFLKYEKGNKFFYILSALLLFWFAGFAQNNQHDNQIKSNQADVIRIANYAQMLDSMLSKEEGNRLSIESKFSEILPLVRSNLTTPYSSDILNLYGNWLNSVQELDSAYSSYKEAENIAKKNSYKKGKLSSLTGQSNVFRNKGFYLLSSKIAYEILPDVVASKDLLLLKKLYIILGYVSTNLEQLEKAAEFGQKLLTISLSSNDAVNTGFSYDMLARVYFKQENYKKSLEYNRLALLDTQKIDRRLLGVFYNNISETFIKLTRYDSAIVYLSKNIRLITNSNNPFLQGLTFVNLGVINSLTNKHSESFENFNKALIVFKNSGQDLYYSMTLEAFSDAYKRAGLFKKSDETFRLSVKAKNKLLATETQRRVVEFNTIYNLAEKQKELTIKETENRLQSKILKKEKKINVLLSFVLAIFLALAALLYSNYSKIKKLNKHLKKQNIIIEKQALDLKTLNHTKDRLFTIISHDLRSPINSYQNLAGTISFLIKSKQFHDLELLANKIDSNGQQLSLLLNSLLTWSLSEQGIIAHTQEKVPLHEIMDPIIEVYKLAAEQKKITLQYQAEEDIIITGSVDILSIIIRNLADNAVKHTIAGGSIFISILKKDSSISFTFCNTISPQMKASVKNIASYFTDTLQVYDDQKLHTGIYLIQQCLKKIDRKLTVTYDDNKVCLAFLY